MAAPTARKSPKETGRSSSGRGATVPPPSAIPTTTSAAIAPTFSSIMALCTLLPARTPRQLMAVSPSSAAAAIIPSPPACPVRSP